MLTWNIVFVHPVDYFCMSTDSCSFFSVKIFLIFLILEQWTSNSNGHIIQSHYMDLYIIILIKTSYNVKGNEHIWEFYFHIWRIEYFMERSKIFLPFLSLWSSQKKVEHYRRGQETWFHWQWAWDSRKSSIICLMIYINSRTNLICLYTKLFMYMLFSFIRQYTVLAHPFTSPTKINTLFSCEQVTNKCCWNKFSISK
jgi:hypothetical protein